MRQRGIVSGNEAHIYYVQVEKGWGGDVCNYLVVTNVMASVGTVLRLGT